MKDYKYLFEKSPLVPTITQDIDTMRVLMLAYMNEESFRLTIETGYTHYFSRSRNKLWKKGETSGHYQKVVKLYSDCDNDTLLILVKQTGPACHTGNYSCFFNEIEYKGETDER
jgi:phosphoribosyl-AMP cyclohydrolase/phosphoribosyl-ATP pyrophosphohydrolase/phosphoribosyl-AMP cyclohydrolase